MSLLFFVNLLNMSVKGSIIIIAVLIARALLKKESAAGKVFLWLLAGIRLICPVAPASSTSIVPSFVGHVGESAAAAVMDAVWSMDSVDSLTGVYTSTDDTMLYVFAGAILIWVAGVWVMALYWWISTLRLKRRLRESVAIRPGVFACDGIGTPFLFGVWNPKLYVPSFLSGEDLEYVIAHEKAHVRRRDHLWKPLAFAVLTLHFFNPLVWVAYFAFCRDLELACDESVTKKMTPEERAGYANALISCSSRERVGCPVAFGGGDVKRRVKAVLSHGKRKILATVVLTAAVILCFFAEPAGAIDSNADVSSAVHEAVFARFDAPADEGIIRCADVEELSSYRWGKWLGKWGNNLTVYAWVMYEEYRNVDGEPVLEYSFREATVFHLTEEDGKYTVTDYWGEEIGNWTPEGSYHCNCGLMEHFPAYLHMDVVYLRGGADEQSRRNYKMAKAEIEYAERYSD